MPFDGITTACIVKELTNNIMGGKIEKVYQPAAEELILHIHGERKNYRLLISASGNNARLHFICGAAENPANPPAFCMLLRKHLQNGRIRGINQIDSERIVEILVDSLDEMGFSVHKKLVIELMGKHSNISLVNIDTGKVLDSVKRISGDVNRYRQLLPGVAYVYPPTQGKIPFWSIDSPGKLHEAISSLKNTDSAGQMAPDTVATEPVKPVSRSLLDSIQGISPFFAGALCTSASIEPNTPIASVTQDQLTTLYSSLRVLLEKIKTPGPLAFDNVVYFDGHIGSPVDFYPFDLLTSNRTGSVGDAATSADADNMERTVRRFDTLSLSLEHYFENKASSSHIKQKSADLNKIVTTALGKLYLKKKRLQSDLTEASKNDTIKLTGELLTANIYKLKQGDEWVILDNYYDGSTIKIALDPRLTPSQNIQRYYKKYNKAKTAIKEKNIQLEETQSHIDYLESVLTFIENAEEFSEIADIRQELIEGRYIRKRGGKAEPANGKAKSKKSGLKPYSYTTSEGFRLSVGRNNNQNDILTLKTASSKDIWFHTKDIPGSHVILFTEGKEPTEASLREAAAIAAYHSKGRQSDNVPVDYVTVKHVRKPAGAKPGMVIYDHHRTLYVSPAVPEQ